jgi:hypothetical protein
MMTPEAQRLAEKLLQHQKQMRQEILLSYEDLCIKAKVPFNRKTVGGFLREVANWCEDNNLPPTNALVVGKGRGKPGVNYENAPGGKDPWPETVGICLTSKYPRNHH